jgi:hypothetical protein
MEPGFGMTDPNKLTLLTPGFDRVTGGYADHGISAPVVAQYLRERARSPAGAGERIAGPAAPSHRPPGKSGASPRTGPSAAPPRSVVAGAGSGERAVVARASREVDVEAMLAVSER